MLFSGGDQDLTRIRRVTGGELCGISAVASGGGIATSSGLFFGKAMTLTSSLSVGIGTCAALACMGIFAFSKIPSRVIKLDLQDTPLLGGASPYEDISLTDPPRDDERNISIPYP